MDKPEKDNTSIDKLGKYGLIDHLTTGISNVNKTTLSAVGDDSAIIDSGGNLVLSSTDLLLEGIHFNLVYTPLKHLGYKAVIRAIADIYAMNGTPGQVLVSIGLSKRFSLEHAGELYEGIRLACTKYGVDLAGGDTSSSLTGLIIGVTAIGTAEPGKVVLRGGASVNDLICVTGDLGASYMGLQLLERERKLFEGPGGVQPDLSGYEYIIGRQLKPEFPVEIISELEKTGIIPTSMIDISEGLSSDLLQICHKSNVGCRIYADKIPIDMETARMAGEFNIDPLIPALNGGEDYELLFTVPLKEYEKIAAMKQLKVIGHITDKDEGRVVVDNAGNETGLRARGWG